MGMIDAFQDEKGNIPSYGDRVWTNTNELGKTMGSVSCNDWSSNLLGSGRYGVVLNYFETWTSEWTTSYFERCNAMNRLYCVASETPAGADDERDRDADDGRQRNVVGLGGTVRIVKIDFLVCFC